MNYTYNDGVLEIKLEDRIDSSNATQIGDEVMNIISNHDAKSLILNADNLDYISSAGLRVVLKAKKTVPDTKITGASLDVYEIFDMTGFTEMMTIEKAYRKLSVDGCEVIGRGANGEVYRLDPDTIIKVYLNPDSLPDIQRERELARKAFVLGIPTAIPYDVVKVGEGYGSVFELLNAKSFAKLVKAEPENVDKYIELYVDLLKKIHSTEVKPGDMPNQKETVVRWVEFLKDHIPAEQYEKISKMVADIPENNHMMHGDYHIKNVMMQNGEVLLIDMDTLCVGDPVFEFASIYLAYIGFNDVDSTNIEKFLGITPDLGKYIWQKTLELYFDTTDKEILSAMADKAMLLGYVRLLRRTIRRKGREDGCTDEMIENCKNKINELVQRVDTLKF